MIVVSGLSSQPDQVFRTPLADGSVVKCTLRFLPRAQMWFIDVEYEDMFIKGLRLCNSLNLLRQYQNVLPFGIYVKVADGTEPLLVNDLQSGRVTINFLTAEEVAQLEQAYKDSNA